jgi:transcriptional regulator with XRE-family HTH domain
MNTIPQDNPKHKYYVYTLAKPDGTVFYIGKGIGKRIIQHEYEARKGIQSAKCDVIREIWATGGEVVKTKHGEFVKESDALSYERYLIKTHRDTLTNEDIDKQVCRQVKTNLSPLGELFDALSRLMGISWEQIALKSGVDRSTISKFTQIGGAVPKRETLFRACNLLRTYPGWKEEYEENLFMIAGYCTEEMQESAKQYTEEINQLTIHLPQARAPYTHKK